MWRTHVNQREKSENSMPFQHYQADFFHIQAKFSVTIPRFLVHLAQFSDAQK